MNVMTAVIATPALALSTGAQPGEAAPIEHDHETDEAYANGLEVAHTDFSLAWLQQWTKAGGSVTIDPADPRKAWIGRLAFELSNDFVVYADWEKQRASQDWFLKLTEQEREQIQYRDRSMFRDRYDGKMEGLYALLSDCPRVLEYVKKVVAIAPSLGVSSAAGEA